MNNLYRRCRVSVLLSSAMALLITSASLSDADQGNQVKWDNIIGILTPGANVGGITGIFFPWTAQEGRAKVDLQTGQLRFAVRGLVLATSTAGAVVGTIGLTRQVKGTLVCNGLSTAVSDFVDTQAVPLDPQGDANFVGQVVIPNACLVTPDKLAFLIRVAEAPGNPLLVDRWIGAGVGRTP